MEKPEERQRQQQLSVDRNQQRELLDKKAPLVPESSPEEKRAKRNPEVSAFGHCVVCVIGSNSEVMNREAWWDMRLSQKRELFQHLSNEIARHTGEPPLKVGIGDIGHQSAYLLPRDFETYAKISMEKCRHAEDFAREVARLHVFDYQQKKFDRDPDYAASPEGIEVQRALNVTGNVGHVRNFLATTQSTCIAGDAARAVEKGILLEAPIAPEKEGCKQEVTEDTKTQATLPQSTESMRKDMVNVLFADPRIYDRQQWDSMKGDNTKKWQLFKDLNQSLAKLQDRQPLSAQFGVRQTALYGDGDQRYALINLKETDDRCKFVETVGMLNLRHVQELNLDNPDYYRGLITNAKITDRNGDVHDMGRVNYREIHWNRRGRETAGTNRISAHSNETVLLGKDIVSAYGELIYLEEERSEVRHRTAEKKREDNRNELEEKRRNLSARKK